MGDLFNDWTKDQDGNYIDWTKPPYYVNGVLNLTLPHEWGLSAEEVSKRIGEYMKLTKRAMSGKNKNAR